MSNNNKTGVINDLLGQTNRPTVDMCENSDHYWPGL